MGLHATFALNPQVIGSDGTALAQHDPITWSSSNTAFVTVDDSGVISGIALGGPVTVTATLGAVSAHATVSVVPAQLDIQPAVTEMAVSTTAQLSATARDYLGVALNVPITWSSDVPSVATVDANTGLLTAVGVGTATITANAAGRTAGFGLYVGVPSIYDGEYQSGPSNDGTNLHVSVSLGRVTSFVATFRVPVGINTCAVGANVRPAAPIAAAVTINGPGAPMATFNLDARATTTAIFDLPGTVHGNAQFTFTNGPCLPAGTTNPIPGTVSYAAFR